MVKYLGVILDETLSFVEHMQSVSSKVFHNVGMMRKLKLFFLLEYCVLVIFRWSTPIYFVITVIQCGRPHSSHILGSYVFSRMGLSGFLLIMILVLR
jgi:hypothetical protein